MGQRTDKLWGALIGLAGACSNNGFSGHTTHLIIDTTALIEKIEQEEPSEDSEELLKQQLEAVHAEKYQISPGCATCEARCGNTDDYDMEKIEKADTDVREAKIRLMKCLSSHASGANDGLNAGYDLVETGETYLKGIAYLSYDLKPETYESMCQEITEMIERMK